MGLLAADVACGVQAGLDGDACGARRGCLLSRYAKSRNGLKLSASFAIIGVRRLLFKRAFFFRCMRLLHIDIAVRWASNALLAEVFVGHSWLKVHLPAPESIVVYTCAGAIVLATTPMEP